MNGELYNKYVQLLDDLLANPDVYDVAASKQVSADSFLSFWDTYFSNGFGEEALPECVHIAEQKCKDDHGLCQCLNILLITSQNILAGGKLHDFAQVVELSSHSVTLQQYLSVITAFNKSFHFHSSPTTEFTIALTNDLADDFSSLSKDLDKSRKRLDSIRKQQKNNTMTSVATLSIFTGVVMAFVGGFQMLTGTFSAMAGQKETLLLFVLSIICFSMFNILWAFIALILKTNGEKLSLKETPYLLVAEILLGIILLGTAFLYLNSSIFHLF